MHSEVVRDKMTIREEKQHTKLQMDDNSHDYNLSDTTNCQKVEGGKHMIDNSITLGEGLNLNTELSKDDTLTDSGKEDDIGLAPTNITYGKLLTDSIK